MSSVPEQSDLRADVVGFVSWQDQWKTSIDVSAFDKLGSFSLLRLALANMGLRIKISTHPPNVDNHTHNQVMSNINNQTHNQVTEIYLSLSNV